MLFLCYPKCSTCRKAQKWLDDHDVDYDIRDIKTDNPDLAELKLWHEASGLPLKKFFNTSGQLYRSMELAKKLAAGEEIPRYTYNEDEVFSEFDTDLEDLPPRGY